MPLKGEPPKTTEPIKDKASDQDGKPAETKDEKAAEKAADKKDAVKAPPGGVAALESGQSSPPTTAETLQKAFSKAQEPPMNGSFTQEFGFDLPAFRGLEPKLRLTYDSNLALRNRGVTAGMLGVGWRLDGLSEIVRTSRIGGTPRFDATDTYQLDGDEIITCGPNPGEASPTSASCGAGGTHATRVESYRRIKLDPANNEWTVTARDGTRYLYYAIGRFPNTLSPDPQIESNYRWLLASITDTHGNVVTFGYACETLPVCWPSTISYNGTTVSFSYDTRPDAQTYGTGKTLAMLGKRLRTIDIQTGGARMRAYALAYQAGTTTTLTRLASVTPYGRDATLDGSGIVTGGSALPATEFGYANLSATTIVQTSLPLDLGTNPLVVIGDFNGDGRQDVLTFPLECVADGGGSGCPSATLQAGTANATFSAQLLSTTNAGLQCTTFSGHAKDVDGDGKDDFVLICLSPEAFHYAVYRLATGGPETGYSPILQYFVAGAVFASEVRYLLGDFDGDGKADIILGGLGAILLQGQPRNWPRPFARGWEINGTPGYDGGSQLLAGDFNGDGKSDVLEIGAGESFLRNWQSTGQALLQGPSQTFGTACGGGLPSVPVMIADFNGDGISDLAQAKLTGSNAVCVDVLISHGTAFARAAWATDLPSSSEFHVGDLNGDGRQDIVLGSASTPHKMLLSSGTFFSVGDLSSNWLPLEGTHLAVADFNGDGMADVVDLQRTPNIIHASAFPHPDLLTSVKNQFGGYTRATYTPSSQWVNDKLPYVLQSVSLVEQDNGLGSVGQTFFGYSGGFYDSVERRFLGFRTARAVLPCNPGETVCPERHYTFRQDVASAGALERKEYWSGPQPGPGITNPGVKLRQDDETWVVNTAPTALPYWSRNTASQVTQYDGGVTKTSLVERTFDTYNNVTDTRLRGDTAITTDDKRVSRGFYPNTASYIVNRPAREFQRNQAGSVIADTYYGYDGDGSTGLPPTKGDVTRVLRWLSPAPGGGAAYPSRWLTYDAYGNKLSETDEVGCRSEWSYDATYQLFPIETRNPNYFGCRGLAADSPRQKTTATYDPVCQTVTATYDIDNLATTSSHDPHCRIATVTKPGGHQTSHYRLSEGNPNSQYDAVTVTPPAGLSPLTKYKYLDGFGRARLDTGGAPTANGGYWYAYRNFGPRGKLASEMAPAYPADTPQWTTLTYDALDRLTRTTHPDGAFMTMAYAGGGLAFNTVTARDEMGRDTVSHKDAHDRVVRIERFLGNSGQTSGTPNRMSMAYDLLDNLVEVTDEPGNR